VVLNGRRESGKKYNRSEVGLVEAGRPEDRIGAHVAGHNTGTLGICFIGDFEEEEPTDQQISGGVQYIAGWCRKYGLTSEHVLGHKDFGGSVCPGRYFPLSAVRSMVANTLAPIDRELLMDYPYWRWAVGLRLLDATAPFDVLTRGRAAMILRRYLHAREGKPAPDHNGEERAALEWAKREGLFDGTGQNAPLIRKHLAIVMKRCADRQWNVQTPPELEPWKWAKQTGLLDGSAPDDAVTRAVFATALKRYDDVGTLAMRKS